MCSIYEHAVCTIAAESARNTTDGVFTERNPLTYLGCDLLSDGTASMVASPRKFVRESVPKFTNLGERAWCFQEISSFRILTFGHLGVSGSASKIAQMSGSLVGKVVSTALLKVWRIPGFPSIASLFLVLLWILLSGMPSAMTLMTIKLAKESSCGCLGC